MDFKDLVTESTIISLSSKTVTTSGTASFIAFMASLNWLGIFGLLVAIIGLMVNIHFQVQRNRREADESKLRIKMMEQTHEKELQNNQQNT